MSLQIAVMSFSFCSALHLTAGLSNSSDLLELLLSFDADVDAMNDDLCSPLFYATQSNNLYAASLLLNHGKQCKNSCNGASVLAHARASL